MARDQEILTAAAELFYQRGFAAVGVAEIGRAAGVTGPAIYRHFTSKDEILASLFDQGMDEVIRVTGGSFEYPFDELDHLVHAHVRHIISSAHLASVWIREDRSLVEPYRKRYLRRARTYIQRWEDCAARCYPDAAEADVTLAVYAVLGMLNALPTWPPASLKAPDLPDRFAEVAASALRSLERRPAGAPR